MSEDFKIPEANLNAFMVLAGQINYAFAKRHGNVESDKERALVLLAKIMEEAGELSSATRALLGVERETRTNEYDLKLRQDVASEAADVIITLLGLLAQLGIDDIDKAVQRKLQVVISRLQSTGHFPR